MAPREVETREGDQPEEARRRQPPSRRFAPELPFERGIVLLAREGARAPTGRAPW